MTMTKTMTKTPAKRKQGRPPNPGNEIKAGMLFGHLLVIMRVNTKEGPRYITECQAPSKPNGQACKKRERIPGHYMTSRRPPKTHCGCMTNIDANPYPRERGIWQMMHQRTENPTHVSYAAYGGRGIKVCWEWNKANPDGWNNFIAYMGGAPSSKHSIDRVDPNLGYQPFQGDGTTRQCRWATPVEQANNQRRHHQ